MRCRHERITVYGSGLSNSAFSIEKGKVLCEFNHWRFGREVIVMCHDCGLERSERPWRKTPRWVADALWLVEERTQVS